MNLPVVLPEDAYAYGQRSDGETHGVVLTKRHVVEFMLDLAGYTVERDLTRLTLLEPACGHGAFVVAAVERLLEAAARVGRPYEELVEALRAYDIDPAHVAQARDLVAAALARRGLAAEAARALAEAWVLEGDFLLAQLPRPFDVVVGNPPYVRIEQLAPVLQAEYRRRYPTLYDRADLYVAFIERGLRLLGASGVLCYLCADRWVLNRYGAPLRALIAGEFRVHCYLDLHDASPFESEVIAYPSIFSLSPGRSDRVFVGRFTDASPQECARLRAQYRGDASGPEGVFYDAWFDGDAPWVLGSPEHLRVLRDLEARLPLLEADGVTRVGIGVATGCDRAFIVPANADVEPDRLIPLVLRADLDRGRIRDAGRRVLNPFRDDGEVVDLRAYPRFAAHLNAHREAVHGRHVAKRNPAAWFRTIDRVYPGLVATPKLLIPDIAGSNEVVFDEGRFHPHHNLYFVTSLAWDLEVLGGLLSSRVALFFVWSYAVKMRGGYLRFQAQYLRRIRVPRADAIPQALQRDLRDAFRRRDFTALDALALRAYGLEALPTFDFVDTRR
ncbi:MAG: Eco57I restriction-modification methylase domain-containing protein [Deltaproteobacteria bacterium]|nr:Eco57I restriction-modification methylase domain-containing protein [Deltaproteobacteria bacterium]